MDDQAPPQAQVIDLYSIKVDRMDDAALLSECMVYLRVLEAGLLTPDHKVRATTLFTKASERVTLESSREDFLIALKVLKVL